MSEQLFENPKGLGEQNLWEVAAGTLDAIPANYVFAPWYGQAAEIIAANVQKMQDGQVSPTDALKASADDITTRLINR